MNLKHVASYHKDHPNPQFYREDYLLLNGYWDFYFDENDVGDNLKFFKEFPDDSLKILVPYAYQAKINEKNIPYRQCDTLWYQKEFEINDLNKRCIIKFLGVDYRTYIYVNNKRVDMHIGGYEEFEYDITDFLKIGKNKITLKVVDRMLSNQFRGKQRWKKDNFTCFYKEFSGIYKDVYLEFVNDTYIKNFIILGDFCNEKIDFRLNLNNDNYDYIELEIIDKDDKSITKYKIDKDNKNNLFDFKNPKSRNNEHPFLYDIKIKVYKDKEVIDYIESYFGFVNYETNNKHIYVNKKDTFLKFVLEQGYYNDGLVTPKEEEILEDAILIKKYGFNGLRKHEMNPSPLSLYYYDLLGLYIWQEMPSAYSYSYDTNKAYNKTLFNQILYNASHPCIMCYVLFNESWGIEEISKSKEEQDFVNEMYLKVKELNLNRFVICNDGWEHIQTDLLTIHNYVQSSKELHDQYDNNIIEVMKGENPYLIDNFKYFFVGDYRYNNQPIILSEFAGIALKKDTDNTSNWGYGESASDEENFLNRYKDLIKFIKESPYIRGFCTTQFSDVEQETNGLVTINRIPKINIDKIKEIHEEIT